MQTTLLGIAIAIILALLSALVGPLLVDWDSYRAEFEQHARRLTGLDVRISGAIDARLLPTPTLMLQGIEFGTAQEKISAQALRVEFSLGALARGEWRISDARLEGPQLTAGLDGSGQLAWPLPEVGFNPESVAIERLTVRDGRATLSDARSGGRVVLDKLEFTGDLRSLAGPIKGAGSFILAGRHYPYRLTTSRIAEDGPVRVRLALDPIEPLERPMTAEADVAIWLDQDRPHYEGSLQLARSVGRAPAGGNALITEPWRLSSRISGDSRTAAVEQIEFQYGPDERALKLRGSAKLSFGRKTDLLATLSSPQVDLDRLLALPEPVRRRPLLALKKLAESFTATVQPPFPATLSLGIDTLALGGAALQRVGALIRADGAELDISSLDFRAPGATQVNLKGVLTPTPTAGLQFIGSSRIEAGDPRALLGWLTDRSEAPAGIAAGTMRLTGDISVGNDAFKVDSLNFELDRMTVAGRLSYAWAAADRPARIGAELAIPEIDLDRVSAVAGALLGDVGLAWPREGGLAVKIGRATIAGVEARQVDVNARIDGKGLEIDRCAIADFGGAKLAMQGRIDIGAQTPRGTLTLDLDAHAPEGMLALATKLAPQLADQLRRGADRMIPASLRALLTIDPGIGSTDATARFRIDGHAGGLRVALGGSVNAANGAFRVDSLSALRSAKVNLDGRIEADDSAALADLLQVDRVVAIDKRPGRLAVTARGPLDGGLAVQAQFAAGAFNLSTSGSVRLSGGTGENASLKANLDVKLDNAPIRSPQPGGAGNVLLPASGTARVTLEGGKLRLIEMRGTVAGTAVGGRLTLGMQQPISVEGDLELSALDLGAVIATAIGMPTGRADQGGGWPSEPFEQAPLKLSGEVRLKAARVALSPKLAARDVKGVLRFAESELAWQAVDGMLAGGRMTGELALLRRADGVAARGRVHLAGANSAELIPGEAPVSGRLTLELTAEGTGMSPVAVIGSLQGGGSFTLENGRLARLDPAAFNVVTRAVDQGLPIDPERVRERMETALGAAPLALVRADGAISINSGQATLTNTAVQGKGADLALAGIADLREGTLDARLTLQGAPAGIHSGAPPRVVIALKGPISAPKRTIDVAPLASWLALRAVEQQSNKLDVLEGRQPPAPVATAQPDIAGDAVEGLEVAVPHTAPAAGASGSKAPQAEPSTGRPHPPQPRSAAIPSPPRPRLLPTEQVQPLDIRPAVPVRPPRPQNGAGQAGGQPAAQAPRPPPAPPRPRSLSEFLFGR